MARTRGAILAAAEACVADVGARATTMSAVAVRGRVAKATLYNHFRTKTELLDALIRDRIEVSRSAALVAPELSEALRAAACSLSGLPAVAGLVMHDAAALTRLTTAGMGTPGPAWAAAREAVGEVLHRHGRARDRAHCDLVLRWLVSQLLWAGSEAERDLAVVVLVAGLPLTLQGACPSARDSMEFT